jgi:hypothetical protein
MTIPATPSAAGERVVGQPRRRLIPRKWNRRIHFYAGLYFLLFIWLFAISGLFLNHSQWPWMDWWKARQESSDERRIRTPAASGDLAIARDLMLQLDEVGEIGQIERSPEGNTFRFQLTRPGRTLRVEADLVASRASLQETRVNWAGVLDGLHRFTGVRPDDPDERRDWLMTRIWSFAMDALAIGLCVMVVTGVYLWFQLGQKRWLGLLALGSGVAGCTFFVFGLARIF